MLPSYRRRILIEPAPGRVVAELEDDYHRMVVTLDHAQGVIVAATGEMKRAPWTMCPGAMAELVDTFTGVALADAARRGGKTRNCTHLHDLAVFAAAHAGGGAATAYDVVVTDPVDGLRRATLARNGAPVFDWTLAAERILAPPPLEGRTLYDLGDWIAALDGRDAEAARILRWAAIVAFGRGMDMPAGMPATAFPPGSCFNFQPEHAALSTRRPGADIDFTVGPGPLADRSVSFEKPSFGTAGSRV